MTNIKYGHNYVAIMIVTIMITVMRTMMVWTFERLNRFLDTQQAARLPHGDCITASATRRTEPQNVKNYPTFERPKVSESLQFEIIFGGSLTYPLGWHWQAEGGQLEELDGGQVGQVDGGQVGQLWLVVGEKQETNVSHKWTGNSVSAAALKISENIIIFHTFLSVCVMIIWWW